MMTCLKYLIPISCVLLLGVVIWPFAMNMALGRSTMIESESVSAAVGNNHMQVQEKVLGSGEEPAKGGEASEGSGGDEASGDYEAASAPDVPVNGIRASAATGRGGRS